MKYASSLLTAGLLFLQITVASAQVFTNKDLQISKLTEQVWVIEACL